MSDKTDHSVDSSPENCKDEQAGAPANLPRRRFIQGVTAAGIANGFAGSLILPGSAFAANPKKGGVLKIGVSSGNTTDSFDPGLWSEAFTQIGLAGAVYNTLVEIDNQGDIIPELATSWESTPDAKTWAFKIRSGVTFHSGKTMDANDVVASLQHHLGEDSKSAAKGLLEQIDTMKVDGDVVTIDLKAGNADFPYLLSDFHIVIMPSKDGKADWQAGVGTGGYTVKSMEPGVRLVLERNPNYWKEGRAHFDGAEVLVIADDTARINALLTGEVHVINRVNLKTTALLERNPGVSIDNVTGGQHFLFPMLMDTAPYSDPNVRMAIKHGVDRQALVDTVLKGYGMVGNDHPISPAYKYYNNTLAQRQFDPDKSKFFLKKAGQEGLKLSIHVSDAAFSGATDSGVLMKEHMKKAGINLDVVREPSDGYWNNVWGKKGFCASYYFGRPTEDAMLSLVYAKDAPWNESRFQHEKFNQLLVAARAELDESKRREMYFELQRILNEEGSSLVPMFGNYVTARSNSVAHDTLAKNAELDGLRVIERWWMA